MPHGWDRVKASFFALMGAADPRAAYRGLFRGTVMGQAGDTVDLKMDDGALPGVSSVSVQVGLPGSKVEFAGGRMLFAFENGDPAKPIALTWEAADGGRVISLTLGARDAVEALLYGTSYRGAEIPELTALKAWAEAVTAAIGATGPTPPPSKAAVAAALAALETAMAPMITGDFLSKIVRTA